MATPAPLPRPEYPRPQCVRDQWLCLNGEWQFDIDQGDSGKERGLVDKELPKRITVPFCPESSCSGIGNTDFLNAVWYRKTVTVPQDWDGKRIILHFGAVDFDATVWVNGTEVVRHRGGSAPFCCDITKALNQREAIIVVRARDDHRSNTAQGKQCHDYANRGAKYTRTTGIWQTVWMEPVNDVHMLRPRITPLYDQQQFEIAVPVNLPRYGYKLRANLCDDAGLITWNEVACKDLAPRLSLDIPDDRLQPWSPNNPFLYDITFELYNEHGVVVDRIASYAGLRAIRIDGNRITINDSVVFQRLVLDQGYYPDGIMTAPSDAALVKDIELAMAAGFNGARLHQKVFEERFYYHCDRLGYLVWGEFCDWTACYKDVGTSWGPASYVAEWLEILERDYSHPAIIGWCPLNETCIKVHDQLTDFEDVVRSMYRATKLADPWRPVIDSSGWTHRIPNADCYDIHCYAQEGQELHNYVQERLTGAKAHYHWKDNDDLPYDPAAGRPFWVSEFGGIWWNAELAAAAADGRSSDSWGYGNRPADLEEFHSRFEMLCTTLLNDPQVCGYCYTQFTDIYQEMNGIYHFDRSPKGDTARLAKAQRQTAAIECLAEPIGNETANN